mmetsp:Transcript_116036/g.212640  ORF Transcript_116036/g.212640 Transcript_116036/m.212640 type:complete len:719 (-) Transcript_116036:104-2260(-)
MGNKPNKEEEVRAMIGTGLQTDFLNLASTGIGEKGCEKLAEALQTNKMVKKLALGWNGIGDFGAEKLAIMLKKNSTLTEVNLTENGITEQGSEKLSQALESNSTIKIMDLMNNKIGDKGAGFFASMLHKNKILRELRLYDTGIKFQGAKQLMTAAERNETLLVLELKWNDIADRRLVSRVENSLTRNRCATLKTSNRLAKRDDLELYILSMRDKLAKGGDYGPYVSDTERDHIHASLDQAEVWLTRNRDTATPEEYRQRLEELKRPGDVVAMRYKEGIMRGQMTTAIFSTIANYKAMAENSEEKYSHVEPAKFNQIIDACAELHQWLSDMRDAQDLLPKYARPVLRTQDMVDRNLELANIVAEVTEDRNGIPLEALMDETVTSAREKRLASECQERRTQLLAYIKALQSRIADGGEFSQFVSQAERERLDSHLQGAGVWAAESQGVPVSHYTEKLQELKSVGDVIEWRCDEDSMRGEWIAAVFSTIANCRAAAESPGDRYGTISQDKLEKIRDACDNLEEWLKSMAKVQEKLAKYERPVLLCADMERRNLELAKMVGETLESCSTDGYPSYEQATSRTPRMHDAQSHTPRQEVSHTPRDGTARSQNTGRQGSARTRHGSSKTTGRQAKAPQALPPAPEEDDEPAMPPPPDPSEFNVEDDEDVTHDTPMGQNRVSGGGGLRNAGQNYGEDERLLEMTALDAACDTILDGDDVQPIPALR